jgi:hypothetical protein
MFNHVREALEVRMWGDLGWHPEPLPVVYFYVVRRNGKTPAPSPAVAAP